ncbi:MAG: 6-bladed beta-propeller [Bacteroidales bacterium]|nr:6-bladed beta-propeller [Bacteroidales bacterium]
MRRIEWGLLLAMVVGGCAKPASLPADVVVFERTSKVTGLTDVVDHIELIPLETGISFLLGVNPMLDLTDDGFVLTDTRTGRILYFGQDGAFRCPIGAKGRGPGEYPMLLNSQSNVDGNIVAFSYPDKVLSFKTDGSLVSEEHWEDLGAQSCMLPEGILSYFGYGSVSPTRVVLTRRDGKRTGFLPSSEELINMTPDRAVFSIFDNTVFFTDTYNPTVYSFKDGEVQPVVSFDFGKSAIDDKFYHYSDPYEAMNTLMSTPSGFSLLRRYQRNERYQFVEEIYQKKDEGVDFHYGICVDGTWNWFALGKAGVSPFAGTMQVISDQCLYFLLDPDVLSGKDHGLGGNLVPLRSLISNPEILEKVTPDDNPVVAKLYLK